MTAPVVDSMDWSLLGISDDGFLSLMTDEGDTRDDLMIPAYPADIADQIQAGLALVEEVRNRRAIWDARGRSLVRQA